VANIFKRRQSPFYVCSFRAADGRWLKKSSKTKDRKVAMDFRMKLEEAERGALQGTLTTSQARKLFNEILERAGERCQTVLLARVFDRPKSYLGKDKGPALFPRSVWIAK
jgi:hypothetical protein